MVYTPASYDAMFHKWGRTYATQANAIVGGVTMYPPCSVKTIVATLGGQPITNGMTGLAVYAGLAGAVGYLLAGIGGALVGALVGGLFEHSGKLRVL